jgi:hypothetical protein
MNIKKFIKEDSRINKIMIEAGFISARVGFDRDNPNVWVTFYLDCTDLTSTPLTGYIMAKEITLKQLIKDKGFIDCDYDIGDFLLTDSEINIILPALVQWLHGADYEKEIRRLTRLFSSKPKLTDKLVEYSRRYGK